jgi:TonB-dependent starch-binding outer membrane protein SusC
MKNQILSSKTACLLILYLLLIPFNISRSYAADEHISSPQKISVSGRVSDETGKPLVGTTISVKGTSNGTFSDAEGKYSIEIPPDAKTLVFSFIGMETQEVEIGNKTVIDIVFKSTSTYLDEVVVVGYGTQKKVNVIGSVTTISNAEITASPVSGITNALAGRLPGAIVVQSNGEPGKDLASILIRGTATLGYTSPLVVIDGIQGRNLYSINNNDVESISILKDASAAIYGSRAANGVILITTKRGNKGPARINYDFYEGLLSPTKLPELADAATYAQMIRENQEYNGVAESNMLYSLEDIQKYKSGDFPWTHPNTNWYDAVLAKYSRTRHHNLSASGGNENVNYYLSFGYHYDGGIYKKSSTSFNRFNVTANVDVKINRFLSVGFDLEGIQENGQYGGIDSYGIYNNGILRQPATYPAYYPNGLPGPDIERGDNPVVTSTNATGFDDDKTYWSNNKFSATLKVPGVDGLTLTGYYAYDIRFHEEKLFEKPWMLYSLDKGAYYAAGNTGKEDGSAFLIGSLRGPTGLSEPRLTDTYGKNRARVYNMKANYEKTINNIHNISAFIAYESSQSDNQGINAFRRYFISDQLPYLFAGGDAEKNNSEYVGLDASMNYFGRLSYNYKETYLFEFSFRRDGSLRFSKESGRWGNFPSVLAGWRVSNENFWKNHLSFINYFKLKASWGRMGNDVVPAFQYLTSYGFSQGMVLGDNRNYLSGLVQVGAPNPLITWETANIYNSGFESKFLNNKMTFNADFFYERRTNILVQRNASVPNYTGITLPDENFGIVDNKGFELELGYDELKGPITYGIYSNFSFARNSVVEFDEPEAKVPWQVLTGHPRGSVLIYKSLGVFRDMDQVNSYPHVSGAGPGDIIIEDFDKDGEITSDDRVLLDKTPIPEITYGISFNLGYGNWRLSGQVQGVGNAVKRIYMERQGTSGNYFKYDTEGRWTPDNINAKMPRAFERQQEYWRSAYVSDYQYHNTDFARLKNIQLSYSLPQNLLSTFKVSNAQIYFSGQNLFMIYSATKIMDPEASGMEAYPLMKVFTLGAKIGF